MINGFQRVAAAACLLLIFSLPVLAQGTGVPTAPAQTAGKTKPAKANRKNGGIMVNMPVEVMDSFASLKDDQKTQITAIQDKLKTDIAAEPDKTKHKALNTKAQQDIRAILTPEQITALQQSGPMVRLLNQSKAIPTGVLAQVKLTSDQRDKIKPLVTETEGKLKAAPKGDKAAQQPLLADFKTKVDALLTPEQKDVIARAPRGKGKNKGKKNTAPPAAPLPPDR